MFNPSHFSTKHADRLLRARELHPAGEEARLAKALAAYVDSPGLDTRRAALDGLLALHPDRLRELRGRMKL